MEMEQRYYQNRLLTLQQPPQDRQVVLLGLQGALSVVQVAFTRHNCRFNHRQARHCAMKNNNKTIQKREQNGAETICYA